MKWTLGIFDFKRVVKEESTGLRGSMEEPQRSCGPGTNTKWHVRVIIGYEAIKSAKLSKPSVVLEHQLQVPFWTF